MDEPGDHPLREERAALGPALAAERERQGLSRADVAHRLHMSPSQVEALEAGDYAHLPKGTFLRGFVRNYAKVLGLTPEPLLEMLAGAAPPAPAPRIVVPTQNIRFDPLGERFSSPYVKAATLALVVVALAFAVMYWAIYVRPRPPGLVTHGGAKSGATAPGVSPAMAPAPALAAGDAPPADAAPEATSVSPPEPAAAKPGVAHGTTPPAAASSAIAPMPSAATAKPPAAAPSLPAAHGEGPSVATNASASRPAADSAGPVKRLAFHFTGDSWVEVRDAGGKVVFQKLNPAGSDAQVSGRAPLSVIVGNAPEVEMTLDGKPFDLDPHTTVAVARFTLE